MKNILLIVLLFSTPQLYSINQDFGDDWIPENLLEDLLEDLVGIIYVGDGTGIFEIVFNLIPLVGNNTYADALLVPIFILFFTGVYWKLKRMGYLD